MSDLKERLLPGTAITHMESGGKAFSQIEMMISATGGLGLSQVCSITGLEGSTIQNWVKRGWVSNPREKKYDEIQVARILIINALKECLKLENIAQLMRYVNGSTESRSDDIIKESELFNYLCEALNVLGQADDLSRSGVEAVAEDVIRNYEGPYQDSRTRLRKALSVMIYACVCTDVKRRTESMMSEILEEISKPEPRQEIQAAPEEAAAREKLYAEEGGAESGKFMENGDDGEENEEIEKVPAAAVQTSRSWFFKKGT